MIPFFGRGGFFTKEDKVGCKCLAVLEKIEIKEVGVWKEIKTQ